MQFRATILARLRIRVSYIGSVFLAWGLGELRQKDAPNGQRGAILTEQRPIRQENETCCSGHQVKRYYLEPSPSLEELKELPTREGAHSSDCGKEIHFTLYRELLTPLT